MGVSTMAIVSLVAAAGSAGMSAYSQSQSAAYNAQVAQNNQIVAKQNANLALEQGQQQEETQRIKTGEMMGAIVASQAASGVNPNTGSDLDVRSSAAETGELDADTIRSNSNLQAQNLKYQAAMYGSQAQLDTAQGDWGIANSILGGASSVSSKWATWQNMGVFSGGGGSGYLD